jgi:hypothetical protein
MRLSIRTLLASPVAGLEEVAMMYYPSDKKLLAFPRQIFPGATDAGTTIIGLALVDEA